MLMSRHTSSYLQVEEASSHKSLPPGIICPDPVKQDFSCSELGGTKNGLKLIVLGESHYSIKIIFAPRHDKTNLMDIQRMRKY